MSLLLRLSSLYVSAPRFVAPVIQCSGLCGDFCGNRRVKMNCICLHKLEDCVAVKVFCWQNSLSPSASSTTSNALNSQRDVDFAPLIFDRSAARAEQGGRVLQERPQERRAAIGAQEGRWAGMRMMLRKLWMMIMMPTIHKKCFTLNALLALSSSLCRTSTCVPLNVPFDGANASPLFFRYFNFVAHQHSSCRK